MRLTGFMGRNSFLYKKYCAGKKITFSQNNIDFLYCNYYHIKHIYLL